jgi:hypothetical protein
MLWFFAVAAVIAAALWGAVRLEKGLESPPSETAGPGPPGKCDDAALTGGPCPVDACEGARECRATHGRACRTATAAKDGASPSPTRHVLPG